MKCFRNSAEHFTLQKGVIFCNHGSFGATPKEVLELKEKYEVEINTNPDLWFRRTSIDLWFQNRQAIAPFFSTNPTNLAFINNATQGSNAVLSSMIWKPGDVILVTDITYPAVRDACEDVTVRYPGVEVRVVQVPYPIESEKQLVDAFASVADSLIEAGKTPRLAIIDAISSMPAIRFPFEKITKVLQEKSIEVFIDGAHVPGHVVDLNLDAIGADYFAGNFHKWLFGPKGTAIFYCAPKHQAGIRAPIVSIDNLKGAPKRFEDPMSGHFFWQGTVDNSGFACITKVLEFVERMGGIQEIHNYNKQLAVKATEILLAEIPNAERFAMAESCVAPYMPNIFVPDLGKKKQMLPHGDLTLGLFDEQKTWLAMSQWKGRFFLRASAQIYNTQDDYAKAALAFNKFASMK